MNPFTPENIIFNIEELKGTGGLNSGVPIKTYFSPTEYVMNDDGTYGGPRKKIHDINSQRNYRNKNKDTINKKAGQYYERLYKADPNSDDGRKYTAWKAQMAIINKNHRLNKKLKLLTGDINSSPELKKKVDKQVEKDWLTYAKTKSGEKGFSKDGRKSKEYKSARDSFISSQSNINKATDKLKSEIEQTIKVKKSEIELSRKKLKLDPEGLTDKLLFTADDEYNRFDFDGQPVNKLEPEYEEVAIADTATKDLKPNLKGLELYYENFLKPEVSKEVKKTNLKKGKKVLYTPDLKAQLAIITSSWNDATGDKRIGLGKKKTALERKLRQLAQGKGEVPNPFRPV